MKDEAGVELRYLYGLTRAINKANVFETVQMAKRTSLADIARATGFAISTVSMALRNHVAIATESKRKIEAAARELGYHPDPLLAALATKQFRSSRGHGIPLAYLLLPGMNLGPVDAAREFAAAKEHAWRLGYHLDSYNVSDFQDGAQAQRVLFSRGVRGILLAQGFDLGLLAGMDWKRFSVVGLGERAAEHGSSPSQTISCAAVDQFGRVLQAWDEVWTRGYRRIGVALFKLSSTCLDDQARWGAAQCCLRRTPPQDRVPTFLPRVEATDHSFRASFLDWVRRHRPEAIIGFNFYFCLLLQDHGLRVPGEIGFATLHKAMHSELYSAVERPEAGMREMRPQGMLLALDLLDQQIRHHRSGMPSQPRMVVIRSEWVDGDTLPRKAAEETNGRGDARFALRSTLRPDCGF